MASGARAMMDWLAEVGKKDNAMLAELRRSLSFPAGTYPKTFRWIERFVPKNDREDPWVRKVYYLVPALWASVQRYEETEQSRKHFASIVATADKTSRVAAEMDTVALSPMERRFITLLESDGEQLEHHLRQLVLYLRNAEIDWEALIEDLGNWNNEQKRVQREWGMRYYQTLQMDATKMEDEVTTHVEVQDFTD